MLPGLIKISHNKVITVSLCTIFKVIIDFKIIFYPCINNAFVPKTFIEHNPGFSSLTDT